MKKNDRISAFVDSLALEPDAMLDRNYIGYIELFNQQLYYEAHDVLEHLWLQGGREDKNYAFFKGLIQFAGAHVHLKKQYLRPEHPKDGQRLRPASRLFHLAAENVKAYGPVYLRLDVVEIEALARSTAARITASDYTKNPWNPETSPRIALRPES